MTNWVAWYGTGESFTSAEKAPHELPRLNVQCIAVESRDHGRIILHGKDFYTYDFDELEWLTRDDLFGLFDYLTLPGERKVVLFGRSIRPARFREIYQMANADPRLPPRSSYSPDEGTAP